MEHNPPVTVLAGLYANTCPVCGSKHRSDSISRPTAVMRRHADVLTSQGYLGYSYTNEKWLWSE